MKARLGIILLGLLLAAPVQAVKLPDQDPHRMEREYEEAAPWKEGAYTIPPVPTDADLVTLDIAEPGSAFTVAVDVNHLSVGEDGVVRYSVALTSDSGVRNLFFEGTRCSIRAYITYAYSSDGKAFQEMTRPEWRSPPSRGNGAFRNLLRENFFCSEMQQPLSVEEMRERIRNPPRASSNRMESMIFR